MLMPCLQQKTISHSWSVRSGGVKIRLLWVLIHPKRLFIGLHGYFQKTYAPFDCLQKVWKIVKEPISNVSPSTLWVGIKLVHKIIKTLGDCDTETYRKHLCNENFHAKKQKVQLCLCRLLALYRILQSDRFPKITVVLNYFEKNSFSLSFNL